MELVKLTKDDIKSFDKARLKETESDVRRELAMMRMDLYNSRQAGKVRSLRRTLARVMTFRNELLRRQK